MSWVMPFVSVGLGSVAGGAAGMAYVHKMPRTMRTRLEAKGLMPLKDADDLIWYKRVFKKFHNQIKKDIPELNGIAHDTIEGDITRNYPYAIHLRTWCSENLEKNWIFMTPNMREKIKDYCVRYPEEVLESEKASSQAGAWKEERSS
ncbi:hypothetical protein HF1_05590 [Mycoplasma haemofelis str. Langford 1]|uniref:Uncharacterized protein n=2 Tax=Mycoplasma haemofelis TaxID=29501 RepID=F6FI29_MYCHI|nr:hypothetical protein [Mycoplasma haemofelis]AEG72877.1 hypothetical protein MHF_0605 [Mycoplasma haemofelis Ohio2]CBY92567.1 hypothetical protein HF1_05590 [Mycoplasma haemofelis str. Langford 1]